MVLDLGNGRYLHTAYAKTNITEDMVGDVWSLTDQDDMAYYGQYEDDSNVDSNDPADYVWTELLDTEVNDETEDGIWPLPSEQVQIDALQDQISILQTEKEELQSSIINAEYNITSNAELSSATADIANATNQHFWTDGNGVHVSNEEGNAEGDRNTLFNSIGMIFRKGANYLTAILAGGASGTDPKGLAIYDGTGNNASNVVASFTDSGAVIGKNATDESRTEISTSGLHIIQNDSGNDVPIADLGYGQGVDEYGNLVVAPFYTFGERLANSPVGNYSVAEGGSSEASGAFSHAEGASAASGHLSHAEGASHAAGYHSHAENASSVSGEFAHSENTGYATGNQSHAEGNSTSVGFRSHAEGQGTRADGNYAHSEGSSTIAYAQSSHAEGGDTRAEGDYSHTQNLGTWADGRSATVIGEYNLRDLPPLLDSTKRADYALIIGNGEHNNESNALTVAWNGDVETGGGVSASDDITTTGDVSGVNVSASGNVTVTGDVSADNITATTDITATGDISADNISASGNITATGYINAKNIQCGDVTFSAVANTTVSATVTFSPSFISTPRIIATAVTGAPASASVGVGSRSATGFTLYLYSATTASRTVNWIAIGK